MFNKFQYLTFVANKGSGSASSSQTNNKDNIQKEKIHQAYSEMGKKGGQARAEQLGHEGYVAMGKKGGQARAEQLSQVGFTKKSKKENMTQEKLKKKKD